MIFIIFSPKSSAKKLAFLTQNKAKLCKILIITFVFEKNVNFFRRKLSKIAENVIIDPKMKWQIWRQFFTIFSPEKMGKRSAIYLTKITARYLGRKEVSF
jgi:hypothetical protein